MKRKRGPKRSKSNWDRAKESFQKYIRVKYADRRGMVSCVTCGKRLKYGGVRGCAQAAHYIPSFYKITAFNEKNCLPSCAGCNKYRHLTFKYLKIFRDKIDLIFGKGTAKELDESFEQDYEYGERELKAIQRHYEAAAKKLAQEKGLI